MSAQDDIESEVISGTKKALENLHLTDCEVSIAGTSSVGDGYSSEIIFVNANGTTSENEKTSLDLVVKRGKSLRQSELVKTAFESEIQIYDKVMPAFEKLQLEKNIVNVLDVVPKFYSTPTSEQIDILILENLKLSGYELHDRNKTLNFNHLKLVLKEYGKLHALSFALKDQNVEEFNHIAVFGVSPFIGSLQDEVMRGYYDTGSTEAIKMLREKGHEGLCKKYEHFLVKGAGSMLLDLMNEMTDEPQRAIVHGDCWNNNFMFKYEGNDKTSPTKVRILDWQISGVRSPIHDLSYFIYANSSQKELWRFDKLMNIYYASFSDLLKQLGSDPEQLFTFEDLKRHWKKYSAFGFLFTVAILRVVMRNVEDPPAPADGEVKELKSQDLGNPMDVVISDKDAYYERIKAIASHYFEYEW